MGCVHGAPGDDWGNAVTYGNHTAAGNALAQTWVVDLSNSSSDEEFTGGGSKDTLGIQQGPWLLEMPNAPSPATRAAPARYEAEAMWRRLVPWSAQMARDRG